MFLNAGFESTKNHFFNYVFGNDSYFAIETFDNFQYVCTTFAATRISEIREIIFSRKLGIKKKEKIIKTKTAVLFIVSYLIIDCKR